MIGFDYLDRQGQPISREVHMQLQMIRRYHKLADTYLKDPATGNDYHVSTLWFGFDYNLGHEPFALFETMVFCDTDENDPLHLQQWKAPTEEDALIVHRAAGLVLQFQYPALVPMAGPSLKVEGDPPLYNPIMHPDDPWFCTQCRDYVEWDALDMTWFEAGEQKCVMCAKGNPYPPP